ncbi:MAG: 7,8-didemethyl-8-hydroxy-5-deazariboflavin synthase subunit CofG [Gemmatimonadaceae bacterium]|nr:7,8-didemethyl-8-hydroxy-5-deazariboflavin synthase subunit CofG [Gloeobacterales cyanobacterium ES-bin-141]
MQRIVTYSPSFTVVPTHECFNRCTYCNFRAERGASWLSRSEAHRLLEPLVGSGVIEVLILSGEVHPRDPRRAAWFAMIVDICEVALSLGFLPHTNCGPLSLPELKALQTVTCSMGLMVEILSDRLSESVHRHAPSKAPELRVEQLAWAGELGIPFTTGVLLGIGETELERETTLETIARLQYRYGHIQEVILQPYRPGRYETRCTDGLSEGELLEVTCQARQILPPEVTLQIPPNLVRGLSPFLMAGAHDLGGIGPVDVVNPDYPHPVPEGLQEQLAKAGWELRRRLPVYPHLYHRVPPSMHALLSNHLSETDLPIENFLKLHQVDQAVLKQDHR